MRGLFVTGTDTGVGKTAVSAALMVRYRGARYWKPIQTGLEDDTAEALRLSSSRLSSSPQEAAYLHGVRLADPVSPHLAAKRAGTRIDLPFLTAEMNKSADAWIVEGAGGALVPVNESDLMVHLMERLGLPVVVVARTTLGTINHTLLTIEAVRARRLAVAGVVMVGDSNPDNRAAIEQYGKVAVLGEMPRFDGFHEDARTTEPGSAEGLRDPERWEGRAGPVRALEYARTTEPGSAESLRDPERWEGRAGPVRGLTPAALAAWAAAHLDCENRLAEFLA